MVIVSASACSLRRPGGLRGGRWLEGGLGEGVAEASRVGRAGGAGGRGRRLHSGQLPEFCWPEAEEQKFMTFSS